MTKLLLIPIKNLNYLRRKSKIFNFLIFVLLLCPFIYVIYFSPYHISYIAGNSSALKLVIFKYTDINETIKKDEHYLIKWPDQRAEHVGLHQDDIIIKKTVCMPGEILEVKNLGVNCNGVYQGTIAVTVPGTDIQVTPYPFPEKTCIADDQYYMEGDTIFSYDSRYFGFIPRTAFFGTILLGI